jgi:hypothetical protein
MRIGQHIGRVGGETMRAAAAAPAQFPGLV